MTAIEGLLGHESASVDGASGPARGSGGGRENCLGSMWGVSPNDRPSRRLEAVGIVHPTNRSEESS